MWVVIKILPLFSPRCVSRSLVTVHSPQLVWHTPQARMRITPSVTVQRDKLAPTPAPPSHFTPPPHGIRGVYQLLLLLLIAPIPAVCFPLCFFKHVIDIFVIDMGGIWPAIPLEYIIIKASFVFLWYCCRLHPHCPPTINVFTSKMSQQYRKFCSKLTLCYINSKTPPARNSPHLDVFFWY